MGKEKQKILKQRNKTDSNEKDKFKYSDIPFMIIHCIKHCIRYVVLSETGMQSEKACAPNKSSGKTFGEKEGGIQTRSEFSKISAELDLKPFAWHQSCKSN